LSVEEAAKSKLKRRKEMLKRITAIMVFVLIGLFIIWNAPIVLAAQSTQVPLAGSAIPKFKQQLPALSIAPQNSTITTVLGNQPLSLTMCEFWAKVLPPGTVAAGAQPKTRVWGYIVGNTCPPNGPNDPAIDTYIGPVIVNQRDPLDACDTGTSKCTVQTAKTCTTDSDCRIPTTITWVNNLGSAATTQVLAYRYSTDQTLHWADPSGLMCMMDMCNMMSGKCSYDAAISCTTDAQCMSMIPAPGSDCAQNYAGPVPAVAHLHGGEVPAEIDGSPDSWFLSQAAAGYQTHGHKFYSFDNNVNGNYAIYKYPNSQEAAPIWFHDHTLGATRLNVYMGLAGAYFIQDPNLSLPANLQPLNETIPLVLQDRMFDTSGQLFFPADSAGGILWALNPEHPYWVPEFVGDTIVVNGKAWPFINVQAKRYRFLFLNGSNARTYEMFFVNPVTKVKGPPMWVISTDGGYLDTPVKIDPALGQKLVMQPGERYGVIIDFTNFPNQNLILRNTGRTPYPKGAPPTGSTLGQLVQFRVGNVVADTSYNPASGIPLRTIVNPGPNQVDQRIVRLTTNGVPPAAPAKIRQLTLNEIMGMPVTAIDPVTGLTTAYPGGPLEILVNNTKWSGASPRTYGDFTPITVNGVTTSYSELPVEGDTEVWEIVNLTADAHPIHLHLVQFQLINRQNFNVNNYTGAYNAAFPCTPVPPATTCVGAFIPAFGPPMDYDPLLNPLSGGKYGGNPDIAPYLQNGAKLPLPQERGWKDTVITYPGQVTRIAVRWAPTSLPTTTAASMLYYPFDASGDNYLYNYVWHCHIVDHEDNEMMRPDVVQLNSSAPVPAARPLVKGTNY
jgi:FtsP/CotA-like multicopper oxidase with cupredoxin domain